MPVAGGFAPKSFRLERGGIDERRLAGHELRQQTAGDGAERQSEVVVTEIEPEAWLAWERPDDRPHVRQRGAGRSRARRPFGRRWGRVPARRARPARDRRRGRIVAPGEFGAGGQSQAPRHRGDEVAALEVEHRPGQARRCPWPRNACDSRA